MNSEEENDLQKIIELNKIELEWSYLIWIAFILIQAGSLMQIYYVYKNKNSSSFSLKSLYILFLAQILSLTFSVKNNITVQMITQSLTVFIYFIFIGLVTKYKKSNI